MKMDHLVHLDSSIYPSLMAIFRGLISDLGMSDHHWMEDTQPAEVTTLGLSACKGMGSCWVESLSTEISPSPNNTMVFHGILVCWIYMNLPLVDENNKLLKPLKMCVCAQLAWELLNIAVNTWATGSLTTNRFGRLIPPAHLQPQTLTCDQRIRLTYATTNFPSQGCFTLQVWGRGTIIESWVEDHI